MDQNAVMGAGRISRRQQSGQVQGAMVFADTGIAGSLDGVQFGAEL